MAKRLKRIPDFSDEEAEREFWAAHDLAATVREPEAPYGVAPPGTHRRQTPRRPTARAATPQARRK